MNSMQIKTPDGTQLSARKYAPQLPARAVVLMPSAMGVPQSYYAPFAEFLAENGVAVLTFDYRGMGESLPEQFRSSLRGFEASIVDWAEQDYNAALNTTKAWQPEVPLIVIGHSLGGQLVGMLPDQHLIDGLITVASGSGYWRDNAWKLKRRVWILWFFAALVHFKLEKQLMVRCGLNFTDRPDAQQTQRRSPSSYPEDVFQGAELAGI